MKIRRADSRGQSNLGWLTSRFSFSFADYFDNENINFGVLRVINDDVIAPQSGFGTHPHRDMEIVSMVLDGQLEHRDSMGYGEVLSRGDVQYMSAGTGILHSEMNPSSVADGAFLQIWILPEKKGLTPVYHKAHFDFSDTAPGLQLVASGFGEADVLPVRQKAKLFRGSFEANKTITVEHSGADMGWYLMVLEGEVVVQNETIGYRDALMLEGEEAISIFSTKPCDILLFDISMDTPSKGGIP